MAREILGYIRTHLGPGSALISFREELSIVARINGSEVQRCAVQDLMFDIPAIMEWISRSVTLEPGDLIFTGTSGSPAELHDGDIVEVSIDGIGTLRNPVRQE